MATNNEMIKDLVENHGFTKTSLKGKGKAALEALLEEVGVEENEPEEKELTLLVENDLQLFVNEKKVLPTHPLASKTVVKNVGGGDLYVSEKAVQFKEEFLIAPGEEKAFTNFTYLVAGSFSRPLVNIRYYGE